MYVEIKQPSKSKQYVYLKRAVRMNGKVKHLTVERLGRLDKLQELDPNIIDKLKAQCKKGQIDFLCKKILALDYKLSSVEQIISFNQNQENIKANAINQADLSWILFEVQSKLSAEKKNIILKSFAPANNNIDDGNLAVVDAVVVAAGVGSRMGANIPKQYLKLDDKCVLEHTVIKLLCSPYIARVIVVISKEDEYFKHTCLNDIEKVSVVYGGKERVDSVLNGIQAVKTPWCLVHDAARPFVLLDDIERLLYEVANIQQCSPMAGGLLVAKSADTLKQKDHKQQALLVKSTLERSEIYRAQTPQLCHTNLLYKAIVEAKVKGLNITDEASAFENINYPMLMVCSSSLNFKLTEPTDFLIAKALIKYATYGGLNV